MAEPLGLASSVVALTLFAFESSKALYELFSSFQGHGSKVQRLREELDVLTAVLESLSLTLKADPTGLDSLKLPLLHCAKACQECEKMVKKCTSRSDDSRTSFRDWVKFNFMGKDITTFTTLVSSFKSTIMIALGDANLRTSQVTVELLREYKTMISSTTFDLEEILQDLDTAMRDPQYQEAAAVGERTSELTLAIDEERKCIQQCLTVCLNVSQHIDEVQTQILLPAPTAPPSTAPPTSPPPSSLPVAESSLQTSNQPSRSATAAPDLPRMITSQSLTDCRRGLGYTTVQLRARLQDLNRQMAAISSSTNTSGAGQAYVSIDDMKEVADSVKQCLNICGEAAEQASAERVNVFEDVKTADDGHQIILSTIGDLISAKRITVGARSAQWLGQMSDETVQQLSKDRGVRLTAVGGGDGGGQFDHQKGLHFENRHAEMVQAKFRNASGGITHKHSKRKKTNHDSSLWRQGSNEEVLAFEVDELLSRPKLATTPVVGVEKEANGTVANGHVELVIEVLSSTGDGLARSPASDHDHVFAIPFCLPGETVVARVRKGAKGRWSNGDFVRVLQASPLREGVSPGCKYFAACSGCQFQMMPYHAQLAHKKGIVERAFRNFSDLPAHMVPAVEETGPSPLQYGYRTKLTPHFDRPSRDSKATGFTSVPPIGFGQKGYRHVMDIENCPLGTPIVQQGFRKERERVAANIASYKSGATILLRESTARVPNGSNDESVAKFKPSSRTPLSTMPPASDTSEVVFTPDGPQQRFHYESLPYHDVKTCISAPNTFTTEYISTSSLRFDTRASSFFQNNNSILPSFLTHLRSIDGSSVAQATTNARLNGISNCGFIEADAADLFADVPYPPAQTVLVIDPPRKGCSVEFLRQMLRWGPARVCYVSCNVHTLARDVGYMQDKTDEPSSSSGWHAYEIESLQGWDFFPQTGHVEGLCVLNRVDGPEQQEAAGSGTTNRKREAARSKSRSRSPKRQAGAASSSISVWDAIKDEVEAQVKDREQQR
ncbi:hypothetical protein DV738_g2763, partial [Chaetothyriales sp. CBS 135597]